MAPAAPKTDPECVRVVVRCRPLNKKEREENRARIVDMDKKAGQVILRNPAADNTEPPKAFTYDAVFDWESTQKEVYDSTARGIVNSVMEGYNGTIFAYGQTGTGKTHTMDGYSVDPDQQGIIPNSFVQIFNAIEASSDVQYLVRASFLEIYNEEIRDLLSKDPKQKLDLKEAKDSGVYVKGLNAFVVKSIPEIRNVLEAGKKNRSVGATLMNQDSSRSHSVFTITIETLQQGPSSDGHIRAGKLNLVDLAGSERQSKTGATGDRLKEATKINLSLSALGNVISALVDGKTGHVPYRDSKLTRLLQDSLGGNTKTVMMAAVGPADWNYDETLSTLRYASRAKNITNKPKINEDPKDAMLREFQEEIKRLKAQLQAIDGGYVDGGEGGGSGGTVEKVVQVARALDPNELERLKAQIEDEVKAEMQAAAGNKELDQSQLAQVAEDVEARTAAEVAKLEEEARKAQEAAAKYSRQQKVMEEKMAKTAEEAQRQKEEKEALQAKLRGMESKLIQGEAKGGLLALTQAKEQEIARREAELAKRRAEEATRAAEISELEGIAAAAEERFASLAEEAEAKTRKLKKLLKKFKEVDQEVNDVYSEFQQEKEDLLDSIRQLHQQMLLKDAVITAFIPQEEVQKVLQRAQWNEEEEAWQLQAQQLGGSTLQQQQQADSSGQASNSWGPVSRPIATPNAKLPMCALTKAAIVAGDMNPRFRNENLLALELDIPERSTFDILPGQGPDPRAQAALDATFWKDGLVLVVGGTQRQQNLHLLGPGSPVKGQSPVKGAPAAGGVLAGSHQQRPSSSSKRQPGPGRPVSSAGRPV